MIKAIHMKGCAPYGDDGSSLVDCAKVNFIYGANGSGKSTICEFLSGRYATGTDECTRSFDCSKIVTDGTDDKILVYDRYFREQNIKESDIKGVFTLGKDSVALQEETAKRSSIMKWPLYMETVLLVLLLLMIYTRGQTFFITKMQECARSFVLMPQTQAWLLKLLRTAGYGKKQ